MLSTAWLNAMKCVKLRVSVVCRIVLLVLSLLPYHIWVRVVVRVNMIKLWLLLDGWVTERYFILVPVVSGDLPFRLFIKLSDSIDSLGLVVWLVVRRVHWRRPWVQSRFLTKKRLSSQVWLSSTYIWLSAEVPGHHIICLVKLMLCYFHLNCALPKMVDNRCIPCRSVLFAIYYQTFDRCVLRVKHDAATLVLRLLLCLLVTQDSLSCILLYSELFPWVKPSEVHL